MQRKDPEAFAALYASWGFVHAKEVASHPWLDRQRATNPDGVDVRKVDLSIELQILAFHAQRRSAPSLGQPAAPLPTVAGLDEAAMAALVGARAVVGGMSEVPAVSAAQPSIW